MNSLCYVVGRNGYKRKQINGKLDVDHSKQIPVYAVVHQYMNLNDRERDIITPIKEEQLREQAQEQEELKQSQNDLEYLRQVRFLPLTSNIKNDRFDSDLMSKDNKFADEQKISIDGFNRVKKMSIDSNSVNEEQSVSSFSSRDHPIRNPNQNKKYNQQQILRDQYDILNRGNVNTNTYTQNDSYSNPIKPQSKQIQMKYPAINNRQVNNDNSIDHYSTQSSSNKMQDHHPKRSQIYKSEAFIQDKKNSQRQGIKNQKEGSISNYHYSRSFTMKNISQSNIENQSNIKSPVGGVKMMDKTQVDSISNRQYPSVKQLSMRDTSISHIDTYTIKKPIKNTFSWRNTDNQVKNPYIPQQQILRQLQRQKQIRKQLQNKIIKLIQQKDLIKINGLQEDQHSNLQAKKFNYRTSTTEPIKKLKKLKTLFKQITQSDELISQNDIKEPHFVIDYNSNNMSINRYDQNGSSTDQNDQQDIQDRNVQRFKEYYQSQKYFQGNLIQYLTELNEKIDNLEERLKINQFQASKNRYQSFLQQKINKEYHEEMQNSNKIIQPKDKTSSMKEHMHYIFTIFMLCIIIVLILKDKSK